MNSTFEFIAIVYLIIGLLIFGNFAYAEIKKKDIGIGIILVFGILPIFFWPLYWPFFISRN